MAEQNYTEEIDLSTVAGVFKSGYRNFQIIVFQIIHFFFRNILWLAGIIIIALLLGWILEKDSDSYEGTAIVQVNFNSANIVYEEIQVLKEKIKEGDSIYLKKHNFYEEEESLLTSIEIEPIVDFDNILPRRFNINERYLQTIFEKSKFKGDLLTSDVFIPKYKRHKIKLKSISGETSLVFDALMNYLNSNTLLNQIMEVSVDNTNNRIEENRYTIRAIDSILNSLGKSGVSDKSREQIYISQYENTNFHMVLQEKSILLEENEELIKDLLQNDKVVKLINRPALIAKKSLLQKKRFVFPVIAVFLFIIGTTIRYFYVEGRRFAKNKN